MLKRRLDAVDDYLDGRYRVNVYPNIEVSGSGYIHVGDSVFSTQPLLDAQRNAQELPELRVKEQFLTECHRCFKTSDYEHGKNINPARVAGTCHWATDHELFQTWLNTSSQLLLWISADPGCGKSVLSKYLVDCWLPIPKTRQGQVFHYLSNDFTICYYFFKDNNEQSNLAKALCAILYQLFLQQPELIEKHALPIWKTSGTILNQESGQLWQIIRRIAVDDTCRSVVCVIDALDECADANRRELIQYLCDLHNESSAPEKLPTSSSSKIKFILTSRPYDSVRRWFDKTTRRFPHIRLKGEETNKSINFEINLAIGVAVNELAKEFDLSEKARACLNCSACVIKKNRIYPWLTFALDDIR